jgi:hypothetical protein
MRKGDGLSSASKPNGADLSPDSDQTSHNADSTAMEPQVTSVEVADIMDDVDMDASDEEDYDLTMEAIADDISPMAEDCSPTDARP